MQRLSEFIRLTADVRSLVKVPFFFDDTINYTDYTEYIRSKTHTKKIYFTEVLPYTQKNFSSHFILQLLQTWCNFEISFCKPSQQGDHKHNLHLQHFSLSQATFTLLLRGRNHSQFLWFLGKISLYLHLIKKDNNSAAFAQKSGQNPVSQQKSVAPSGHIAGC